MRYFLILITGFLLSGCVSSSPLPHRTSTCLKTENVQLVYNDILSVPRGSITRSSLIWDKHVLHHYEIKPKRQCDFAYGYESVLEKFFSEDRGYSDASIKKLSETRYAALFEILFPSSNSSLSAILEVQVDSIHLLFGSRESIQKFLPCYGFEANHMDESLSPLTLEKASFLFHPEPFLFSQVFACELKEDSEIIIPSK